MPAVSARTRTLTVVAQDPGVHDAEGRILTTRVAVPAEELLPGPWGYRVQVIDYDSSTRTLYAPLAYPVSADGEYLDPYDGAPDQVLLNDPGFHAQNTYALVMKTLARFEFALGRRIPWGFGRHQLKVAPHAFGEANAYYSRGEESLLFGYFPSLRHDGLIYSCLSHDVIVHETTHAVLDALRQRYTEPSSPDQAAFHEGFADIVALLSVFSLDGVVAAALRRGLPDDIPPDRIPRERVEPAGLRISALLGLAEEMGSELSPVRGQPLRRSVELEPSPRYLDDPEFRPAHRRGEVLVAAVMNAFVEVWSSRVAGLREFEGGMLDRDRVVEEGATAADYLLTMCIRGLDYTPPVHLEFADFLNAVLTADYEIRPREGPLGFRAKLRESFEKYGIRHAGRRSGSSSAVPRGPAAPRRRTRGMPPPEPGLWTPCNELMLSYDRTHFEPMAREPDEVFRFVWENRRSLVINPNAYSAVESVRTALRIGPDGFALRETVAEFFQMLEVTAADLREMGIEPPPGMVEGEVIYIAGGATLIFDEYGRLKYYIHNSVDNAERQTRRLRYRPPGSRRRIAIPQLHLLRFMDAAPNPAEEW